MTTAEPTEQRGPLRWVDGTMPALQERVLHIPVVGFIEYCLRGVGQVVPALTLPFCFGTLAFVLLKDATKHFTWVPPAEVVTPEEHLRRARTRQESSAPAADVETETA